MRVAKKVVTRYVVYNGKTPSRFVQVGGKKVPVTKATPGAVKLQEETGDYYGFWYEGGKEHQKRLCRDKKAAARMLSDYLTQKERSKVGLAKDPDQEARERAAATPDWRRNLEAFREHLVDLKRGEVHVRETVQQIERLFALAGVKTMLDVTADRLGPVLRKLPHGDDRLDEPRQASARTKEKYRKAVCSFTKWLARPSEKRWQPDPLAGLEPIPQGAPTVERRWLTAEDLQKLIDAARERPLYNALHRIKGKKLKEDVEADLPPATREKYRREGIKRALAYKFAALTAARRGAIRQLTVDALQLDRPQPVAVFTAKTTKGKRTIKKPLPPEMVEDLRKWIALVGLKGTDRVFRMNAKGNREMDKDLAFAGIPKVDSLGRKFDFHAIKKSTLMAMARANVHPDVLQAMGEHKDIRTTKKHYSEANELTPEQVFPALPKLR